MSEIYRLIVGLKAKGMPADEILDLYENIIKQGWEQQ